MTIDAQTAYDEAQAEAAQVTGAEIRDRLAEQAHDDAAAEEAYEGTVLSDHELALSILDAYDSIENMHLAVRLLEGDMRQRIEATGGTALPDDEIEMKLEPGKIVSWETNHLIPLKEILTTDDLAKVFKDAHDVPVPEQTIPAHTDHVPAKWADGVKLNAIARQYGDRVADAVARAGIRSDPRVVVKRR